MKATNAFFPILLFLIINIQQLMGQENSFCLSSGHFNEIASSQLLPAKPATSSFPKDETIFVKTVVHVLYYHESDSISDERIIELLEGTNELFRGEGFDHTLVMPEHRNLIHDSKIQFCLVETDPLGMPTNGITRRRMDFESFNNISFDDLIPGLEVIKADSSSGVSPWDTLEYLNLWIAPIRDSNIIVNYGSSPSHFYPGGSILSQGIPGAVIDMDIAQERSILELGDVGTLAHEFGHALGLLHSFGTPTHPLVQFCNIDDFIDDTPKCSVTYSCRDMDSCEDSTNEQIDNFANIMNYACARMFTPQQSEAMRDNLATIPGLLMDSEGCGALTQINNSVFENTIQIFPNPTDNLLHIRKSDFNNPIKKVRITSSTGQTARMWKLDKYNTGELTLELEFLTKGIYLISIHLENGDILNRRMIKT